jgi:hypothetical protein
MKEIFDSNLKLFRYDYINENKAPVTEVHDFNTGRLLRRLEQFRSTNKDFF